MSCTLTLFTPASRLALRIPLPVSPTHEVPGVREANCQLTVALHHDTRIVIPMRARFEAACALSARDTVGTLTNFLEPGAEAEAFWQTVRQSLQAGHVRLVFVANIIPGALADRRVSE
jgi:hypothetical protein